MIKYSKIFIAFTLSFLVLMQCLATAYLYILISEDNEISAHRMMQIRAFPDDLRCGITKYWINKNISRQGVSLVVGDSQPMGFNAQYSKIFSVLLSNEPPLNSHIFKNASIQDGHFGDTRNVLNIIASANIRLQNIVLNVDPAHFKQEYVAPKHLQNAQCPTLSLSQVFLEQDLLTSMKSLAIMNILNPDVKQPWLLRNQDTNPLPPEIMSVPADYISEKNNEQYERDFISTLKTARAVSDKTIVYMSPMQLYKKLPHTQQKIRARYMQLCKQFSYTLGGIACLDPNDQFDASDFLDIIHLSSSGHRKMANLLRPIIEVN